MPRRPGDLLVPTPGRRPDVIRAAERPPDEVRRHVRSGQWERVARGVYLPTAAADEPGAARARAVEHARIVGIHERLAAPHWFSHESAALVWGLPLWRLPAATHVLHQHRRGLGADPAVRWHHGCSTERDRAVLDGLPVTSLARTVVDCAAALPALHGLVVADAALRAGVDPEVLAMLLDERTGRRGVHRARAVIGAADGGAESAGESGTRYLLLRAGLPAPTTQVRVATRLGSYWGDLGWEEWRLLLEYDGRSKYRADADALAREKRRHDAIVEAGWRVLRVTKEDLVRGDLVSRVHRLIPQPTPLTPRRYLQ